jgi:hypothetical protein
MSISFPNASRAYDTTRDAVRFWGHDSTIETSFYVTAEALRRIEPDATDEESLLRAFDAHRARICSVAAKHSGRSRGRSYWS